MDDDVGKFCQLIANLADMDGPLTVAKLSGCLHWILLMCDATRIWRLELSSCWVESVHLQALKTDGGEWWWTFQSIVIFFNPSAASIYPLRTARGLSFLAHTEGVLLGTWISLLVRVEEKFKLPSALGLLVLELSRRAKLRCPRGLVVLGSSARPSNHRPQSAKVTEPRGFGVG